MHTTVIAPALFAYTISPLSHLKISYNYLSFQSSRRLIWNRHIAPTPNMPPTHDPNKNAITFTPPITETISEKSPLKYMVIFQVYNSQGV